MDDHVRVVADEVGASWDLHAGETDALETVNDRVAWHQGFDWAVAV